jgi:spore coat protein CotH
MTYSARCLAAAAIVAVLASLIPGCGGDDTSDGPAPVPVPDELAHVFPANTVPHVSLVFDDGFEAVLGAFLNEGDLSYRPATVLFNEESAPGVGVRLKGNLESGFGLPEKKYGFKVNFDLFDGPHFHDVDSLHLQNNKPDPSAMREILAMRFYDAMGVMASKAAFVTVEVDGKQQGLYTLVEEVDKRFLKFRFGTLNAADDGNLYKCVAPGCSLDYTSDDREDYFIATCDEPGGCGLVLKTNTDDPAQNDYADLVAFLALLEKTPDAEFEQAISNAFEVDAFLRYLAVAASIGHYESYLDKQNNFFLYHRPDTGTWTFIPWDANKTFGASKCPAVDSPAAGPVDPPVCGKGARVLADRILAVDAFHQQYLAYVDQVFDTLLTPEQVSEWIAEADTLIRSRVQNDPAAIWDFEQYEAALTDQSSDLDPMNLLEFVVARRLAIESSR